MGKAACLNCLRRGGFSLVLAWSSLTGLASNDMLIYSGYTNVLYGTMNYNNGWQNWGWVPNYVTNNPGFNGTNSIVFAASSTYQALYLEHDPIDTTLYTNLTLWLNGGSVGGQTVGVQAEQGSAGGTRIFVTAPTNSWQQFTFSLASLGVANMTNLNGIQIWNSGTLQSNFYIGGITLVAAPTPAIVHVSVIATNPVRTVDPRVFGINTAVWDGDFDTLQTAGLLQEMGATILRFPGGSLSDQYNWSTDKSLTNTWQWGTSLGNFIHVITNLNGQAMITVNYGTGSTNEAAAWVAYVNATTANTRSLGFDATGTNWKLVSYWAALRGSAPLATDDGKNFLRISRPAPLGFKYWEVGNEVFGSWEEDINTNLAYFGQEVANDPWTYAMRFKDYYNAMKAVDPTIKIGAVALPDEVSYANNTNHPAVNPVTGTTNYGWTAVMLNTMRTNGVTPDFLIEHNYAPGDGDTYNLLWTKSWVSDAVSLRRILNDYLGSTVATNIELVDTEFGPEADKQWISLVGGLFAADAIGQVLQTEFNALFWWDLRNGQAVVTNSDNALYGWRTNSSGSVITDEGVVNGNVPPPNANFYPSYYCMELMQYFARGGDTVVTVTNDCKLLGTYAVQRTNGTMTMLVINKSSSSNLTAVVTFAGYLPTTNAIAYSYGIPQDTAAQTGTGSLDIVQTNLMAGISFSNTFAPYSATVLVFNPAPPPTLIVQPGTGQLVVQIQGQPGARYGIQDSTNLTSWNSISTNTTGFTNPFSGTPNFYRAVWLP